MANAKNPYKQQGRSKQMLLIMNQGKLSTKGDAKNTLLETGKDIMIGVLGGGLVGAIVGKPAFAIGLLTTGTGHYTGNKLLSLLGVGIMAANTFQKATTTVNGLDGLDGMKERVMAFKDSMSDKLFLDKLLKKKTATTNGIGEVDYFNYTDPMKGHLAALDDIENQVVESALQFQGQITGNDYSLDMGEVEERLY